MLLRPRVPNSEAHRRCGDYIAGKFKSFGATVTDQRADLKAYDGTVLKARNIIASYNPEAEARILVCAHWDSRPWADNDPDEANWHKPVLAANDGASGVAVMLEMARQLQASPSASASTSSASTPKTTASRNGTTGPAPTPRRGASARNTGPPTRTSTATSRASASCSTWWAAWAAPSPKRATRSNMPPRWWTSCGRRPRKSATPSSSPDRNGGYITDDHVPVNQTAGIPCIDIVPYFTDGNSGFGPTWHTVDDDMEHIDRNVLKAVGQTVLQVIYNSNE